MAEAKTPNVEPDELELDEPSSGAAGGAALAVARSRGGLLRGMRWFVRGLLLLVCVACVVVGWWGRRPGGLSTAGRDWAAVVTLNEGPIYGEAVVIIGDPETGKSVADDAELRQAIGSALSAATSPRVLVQAAPGVSVGAVERVQRIVQEAKPGQTVEVTLGLYEPAADEPEK